MKKSLLVLCGLLSLAVCADPAAPADEAPHARAQRQMQKPTVLVVNDKTSPEDIAAFKAEVAKKIDEAMAAYAAKSAEEKRPVRLVLFSNDGAGMGQRGQFRRPNGDRPEKGQRRRNGDKGGHKADAGK